MMTRSKSNIRWVVSICLPSFLLGMFPLVSGGQTPAEESVQRSVAKTLDAGPGTEAQPKANAKVLLDPKAPEMNKQAPGKFLAKFSTSKGDFTIEVQRAWAPRGADRFYNLVSNGYYDDVRFFRAITGFMVQFGIHGDPKVSVVWRNAEIPDDPVKASNKRGMVTFATAGPNARTTQVFVNFGNNDNLDGMGFAPFGKVIEGMKVVDSLYAQYGEGAPSGRGPDQSRIQAEGNAYLTSQFPKLDYVKTAKIVE